MNSLSSFSRALPRHLISASLAALPLAILASAGCSGDVRQDPTSTSTGADTSTSTGTGGGTSTGSSASASTGIVDGSSCSKSDPCPSGAVCVVPPYACQPDAKGTCQSVFQCDGPPTGPLCDCAGKVVEGEYPDCGSSLQGSSYGDSAPCQTGTFDCGFNLTCKRNSEVCIEKISNGPSPNKYECAAFETVNQWCQHDIPDCDCINPLKVAGGLNATCSADDDHQETITITAP